MTISPDKKRDRALGRLQQDAVAWRLADAAYAKALAKRRKAIMRSLAEGLTTQTIATAYAVSRQYISEVSMEGRRNGKGKP